MEFFRHIPFFRVPLNVLLLTPGGKRTPGWESLMHDGCSSETNTGILVIA
jgi:hypothetical protein